MRSSLQQNISTIKRYGPDRIAGFTPSWPCQWSYALGARYLSLIGGAVPSFYDFYCDLPNLHHCRHGEQTDAGESADWYNSHRSDMGFQRASDTYSDSPFYTQCDIRTKVINISPLQ
ncbi:MAG: molybdopterin-dependent oxidoreductase [Bacteroidales bacterium]|nr:molybdopterin-dependent oxidoreductase [Bacteroidales bacterium]